MRKMKNNHEEYSKNKNEKSAEKSDEVIEISFKNYLAPVRKNPWILVSIVLIIALIGVLIMYYNSDGSGIGEKSASDNLIKFINSQGGGNATVVSSSTNGSLYQVVVNYQGEDIPVYVTRDGNYLITTLIPLANSGNKQNLPAQTGKVEVVVNENDPSIGDKNAPVTIVEFSDFSCPFCGAASGDSKEYVDYMKSKDATYEPAVPGIMKDYINNGKVRLVFKYFPGHGSGEEAQLVGWCLNEQGLFWKFHDKAFANQADTNDLTKMKALAKGVGADMTKLDKCLADKKYDSKLAEDTNYGKTIGVSGTPAFFVNGKLVSGAISYVDMKAIIEAELAA